MLLAQQGLTVFGTSRNPNADVMNCFELLPLDVRSPDSVDACLQIITQRTNRLDVLINNAGYATFGAIEETSLTEAKAQFETNFFGVVRVSMVEPQAFNTDIRMQPPQHLMSIYDTDRQKVVNNIEDSIRTGQSPIVVAQLILQILNSSSPRLRYRAGTLAKAFHLARRFSPEPVYEQILRHHFRLDTPLSKLHPNAT